ncbi:hypothetical protein [Micromonospora chokoriensis]
MFLLPFMLCNVALWMRPPGQTHRDSVVALCRLLALSLTTLYVLSIAAVSLDLIAWRCMGTSSCFGGRPWLSWLGQRPPGLRLGVMSLIPAAAIAIVWWLSVRSGRSFDAFRALPVQETSLHRLSAVKQWDASLVVARLRSIHIAVGFVTLSGSLLVAQVSVGTDSVSVLLLAAVGAVFLACLVTLTATSAIETLSMSRVDRLTRWLCKISCGLTALVVSRLLMNPEPWPERARLPGFDLLVAWLFVSQTVLLAGFTAVVILGRGARLREARLQGVSGPILVTVSVGLAVAFSAELVCQASDLLNGNGATSDSPENGPPLPYTWAIFGFFLAVLSAVAIVGVVVMLTRSQRRKAAAAIVANDFPHAPPQAANRLRQVEQAIARARFTERLPPLTAVYAGLAMVGLAASIFGVMELHPADAVQRYVGIPSGVVKAMIGLGGYSIVAIVLGLVVGGIFAYRTPQFRRYVGVIWDLGTFWPQSGHPFAPPCYAERAVPELRRRVTHLVEQGARVLLAGHSHGSVLIAATVMQLPPRITERVALLTYGAPLSRLCSKLFPAFFGPDVLWEVGDRVGWRWVNLWRDTDPIGGWMFSPHRSGGFGRSTEPAAEVDRRLVDPPDVIPLPHDSALPMIHGHWPCESEEAFATAERDLAERLRDDPGRPFG